MNFIGIDLGTSSVKMILTDEKMNIIKQVSKSYPLDFSEDGKSEQNPADWWNAVKEGLCELTSYNAGRVDLPAVFIYTSNTR